MKQEKLIHKGDWDLLIILDACRYDYFEDNYEDYLKGKLQKVRSPASDTVTWLLENFSDSYDIRYFSGNPFINSYGFSLMDKIDTEQLDIPIEQDWNANDVFSEVVDAWDWAWDGKLGLVNPWRMVERYENASKRTVIHFVQPHAPYVGFPLHNRDGRDGDADKDNNWFINGLWDFLGGNSVSRWVGKNIIDRFGAKVIGWSNILKLQELTGRDLEPIPQTCKTVGAEKMPDLYQANLRFVLEAVKFLVGNKIPEEKKVVVSADHGELLGMKRPDRWGHPPYKEDDVLRNVSWLEVDGIV